MSDFLSRETPERWVDGEGVGWSYVNCGDGTCAIAGVDTPAERLVVPAAVAGLEVTAIGPEAFAYTRQVREVALPRSLRFIGYKAFAYCSDLEDVSFPEGLRDIGGYAFMGTALARFVAPDALERIGEKAFYHCTGLADIELNEGLVSIGAQAFADTAAEELVLPRSLTEPGARLLEPNDPTREVRLRVADGNPAFLTDVAGTTLYRRGADGLVLLEHFGVGPRAEVLPGTVAIAPQAFAQCKALEEVELPDGLVEIGEGAFHGCASLLTVELPQTVKSIGPRVFVESGLRCLNLPASLEELSDDSLINRDGVRSTVAGPSPVIGVDGRNPRFFLRDGLLYRRDDDGEEVALFFSGDSTSVRIPRSVTRVGKRLLFGATGIKELVVHDGLNYFASQAFATAVPVPYVRIELNEPSDGADAVELWFSSHSASRMNFISAFADGYVDAAKIAFTADAGIRFFLDHYVKGRVILNRLLNPVFLDEGREGYLREQMGNVLEPLCRGLAEQNRNEDFRHLAELGFLDGDAFDRVLEWARESGSASSVGYLLQLRRDRDGVDPMAAYDL